MVKIKTLYVEPYSFDKSLSCDIHLIYYIKYLFLKMLMIRKMEFKIR